MSPYGTVRAIEDKTIAFMSTCELCNFLTLKRNQADAEDILTDHLKTQHHVRPKITVDAKPGPLFFPVQSTTPKKTGDTGAV